MPTVPKAPPGRRRAYQNLDRALAELTHYTNASAIRGDGIDLGVLARIVPLSAGASRTFDNIPRSVLNGAFTAGGTLDIVAKDLHLACELAREVGAPAHLGLLAHDVFHRAQAQGWGHQGFPAAARILEAMAGSELRASPIEDTVQYQAEDPRRGGQR